jgi:putative endonuclease
MENYWVYILYSISLDRFYIGYTSDLASRLAQHTIHIFKGSFTDKANDWEVFFSVECENERQAIAIEKHIKKNKSRKYLENIKVYPEISSKLLEKYK